MRRQWPCSKCGFACSSTWRSLNPSKPVICNTCRSKESKNKINVTNPPQNLVPDDGAQIFNTSNFDDQISHSSSINMALTVSQIGMIFGNLPLEPTLAIPVIVHGPLQEYHPKVKSKVNFVADDHNGAAINGLLHDQFYDGTSLEANPVLEGGEVIQIKQEYDGTEETLSPNTWDSTKVQKKRRSKLPQYTLSPLARFISQLQHVSRCYYRPNINKIVVSSPLPTSTSASKQQDAYGRIRSKYDDVLIYEKCKYVAENEIGLGAMLLSPPPRPPAPSSASTTVIKTEPCSASETDSYSNCLIDVPITSPSE